MALILNLVIPGAGLMLRGRYWLGFALAMLFALAANVAIAGWLVAPVAIPRIYSWTASIIAVMTWVLAQVLIVRHPSSPADAEPAVGTLLEQAQDAMSRRDWTAARTAIDAALELNQENAEMNDLRARVNTLAGPESGVDPAAPNVRKSSDQAPAAD